MHAEAESMGGVGAIKVNPKYWIVSDDTVMHIATAKALLEWNSTVRSIFIIYSNN
jgi:ADP-ribosylarginine hydrolase